MKVIHYDNHFNGNEWFVIISIVVGLLAVLVIPKRFTKKTSTIYLLTGVFFGFFFDHTLSVIPVSYYDLNDTSLFELTDFLSHVMYSSYSYFFFYLYDYLKVKARNSPLYILIWTFISVGIEKISAILGVYHYKHGYTIFYSFVIYLIVHSIWVALYYVIERHGEKEY
ncbi:hypothetical protein EKG37_07460 [Robertmurraya yapensis]|uniref:Uncharacterized protein n=2 Tax=Bacillaceae TaxID=186817 RepID=A0A3S0IJQ5_9BACI|nr:hypothetical protein [Bacillus yapensis]RTR34039.1 hypothetical protein EKG37_07460 [Bacillus yapensis]TKS97357.1 hypothetical protein FAR12_07460 [Bacillus yapensis]